MHKDGLKRRSYPRMIGIEWFVTSLSLYVVHFAPFKKTLPSVSFRFLWTIQSNGVI